jgi:predicted LPLAT superfamily acyltransferase
MSAGPLDDARGGQGVAPAAAALDWASTPERSNAAALGVMRWIALRLGRRAARGVLHLVTAYFLLVCAGPRRQSCRYLARALGRPAGWRDLYRHFFSFAATVLDRVYLLSGRMDLFDVTVHDEVPMAQVLEEGRGAFMVGAHVGSFEVLNAIGRHGTALRVAMVMYPDNARLINATLQAVAPGYEAHIIPLGRMESMLTIRDWLDGGGLAGMLGDRTLPGESLRSGTVTVPFLGREAVFPDGPFRLAALLRRRVVFMAGLYEGGSRYEVRFETLADFSERASSADEREQRVQAAVRAYAARLEALCRTHPTNWFNFHDFWREDAR